MTMDGIVYSIVAILYMFLNDSSHISAVDSFEIGEMSAMEILSCL